MALINTDKKTVVFSFYDLSFLLELSKASESRDAILSNPSIAVKGCEEKCKFDVSMQNVL